MITVMRKHHKWLMIVISILAIPFIFYFVQQPDYGAIRSTDIGRIYDRPVTNVEFQRSARLFTLAQMLGLPLSQDLMMRPMSENDAYINFAFNRIVLNHETQELGIKPTQAEIVAYVKTLRPFQGDGGQFDIKKYTDFAQTRLPALGFTEAQLEELVSDQLSLNRVKDLLGAGLHVADSESRDFYEQAYGKLQVAVVRFREEDFQKDLKLSDEDAAKYYEAHKAELKTDEKRTVEFVAFKLSDEEAKLAGKEKVDAMQKLANRANDFVQALLEKDAKFPEVAAKFGVPVAATGEFTTMAPDPLLASVPALTQYAFQLKSEEPFSDAVQGPDGFYVMHLLGMTPSRPLTLDEAKPKVVEKLAKERLRQMVAAKGADIARTIREAITAGTPLDTALNQVGLQAERIPPFAIMDPAPTPPPTPPKPEEAMNKKPDAPDMPMIKNAVRELNPGDASEFVPTPQGGLIAVVEKRDPADPAGYEQAKTNFEKNYLQSKREAVFDEWLHGRRQAAGLQGPPPEVKPG
ncbi:MAG TPA: peptidylprolyl isomerase [Chthoniobacterales bacterium]|nr:peptidylprolyl isomerase [Chthoniobacterales bacterium]